MQDRYQLLKEWTLLAISDDYEDVRRISQEVARRAGQVAVRINRGDVISALADLVNEGYAQAYLLSEQKGQPAIPVPFSESRLGELWFYVTEKGKRLAIELARR
jgi:hypothetical protein